MYQKSQIFQEKLATHEMFSTKARLNFDFEQLD